MNGNGHLWSQCGNNCESYNWINWNLLNTPFLNARNTFMGCNFEKRQLPSTLYCYFSRELFKKKKSGSQLKKCLPADCWLKLHLKKKLYKHDKHNLKRTKLHINFTHSQVLKVINIFLVKCTFTCIKFLWFV